MRKFIAIIISVFLLFALNGCGKPFASKDVENDKDGLTETVDDTDSKEKNDSKDTDEEKNDSKANGTKKLSKSEIAALNEDSKPFGIYGIEMSDDEYGLTGYIKNNSDEAGRIIMTVQMYDEDEKYVDDLTVESDILESGDIYIIDEYVYNAESYHAKISKVSIQSGEAAQKELEEEAHEQEKLNLVYEIGNAIDEGNYNYASALLEEFKEKYPEETAAIRRVEAFIKDAAQNSGDDEEAIDDEWLNYDFEGLLDD